MSAIFQLEDTFTITGRGLVLSGQILDGVVRIGDRVHLPAANGQRVERITGVSLGHGRAVDGSFRSFVGLLLGELPASEIPPVRSALAVGEQLRIEGTT